MHGVKEIIEMFKTFQEACSTVNRGRYNYHYDNFYKQRQHPCPLPSTHATRKTLCKEKSWEVEETLRKDDQGILPSWYLHNRWLRHGSRNLPGWAYECVTGQQGQHRETFFHLHIETCVIVSHCSIILASFCDVILRAAIRTLQFLCRSFATDAFKDAVMQIVSGMGATQPRDEAG